MAARRTQTDADPAWPLLAPDIVKHATEIIAIHLSHRLPGVSLPEDFATLLAREALVAAQVTVNDQTQRQRED